MTEPFCPEGDLTAAEVPDIYRRSLAWKKKSGQIPAEVDLSQVGRCDSSALALLLEWAGWAREKDQAIHFSNPPANLVTIASLSETGPLLGFEAETDKTPSP